MSPSSLQHEPPPKRLGRLQGRTITLCVTGSIAAYKAALVARLLVKEGASVHVLLSDAARHFVGPMTFTGITGNPVHPGMFESNAGGESHVQLAARTDLLLIVPATADVIARVAGGRADDAIGATVLCSRCPIMIVPAMHPNMWSHPATQRNMKLLEDSLRVERVGPVHGEVASGESGEGRMADPEQVLARVLRCLSRGDLHGKHIVVTAGPTVEDIDPVRFIANRSSGKMGFALAERAALRGAQVTLIAGPVSLTTPFNVNRIDVRSAVGMRNAVWQAMRPDLSGADALIMAAAVADYRPTETRATKVKKDAKTFTLELTRNPDILAEIGSARVRPDPLLVGFALETGTDDEVLSYAHRKLEEKRVDLVVANRAQESLDRDDNRVALVAAVAPSIDLWIHSSKAELAERILDWMAKCFAPQI